MAKTRFTGNRRAGKSSITAAALTVLEAQENRTYKQKTEQALIVDDDGNVLLKKRGGRGSVRFTYQEVQLMKDHILTHNHPEGGVATFSPEDVIQFQRSDMKAIRATSRTGTFTLERTDQSSANRHDMTTKKYPKDLSWDYQKYMKATIRAANKACDDSYNDYKAGKIAYTDYSNTVDKENDKMDKGAHDWLTQNAADYGYKYTFERRK